MQFPEGYERVQRQEPGAPAELDQVPPVFGGEEREAVGKEVTQMEENVRTKEWDTEGKGKTASLVPMRQTRHWQLATHIAIVLHHILARDCSEHAL